MPFTPVNRSIIPVTQGAKIPRWCGCYGLGEIRMNDAVVPVNHVFYMDKNSTIINCGEILTVPKRITKTSLNRELKRKASDEHE